MLARGATLASRVAGRVAGERVAPKLLSVMPTQQRAAFATSMKRRDPEVPVIHYENGKRTEEQVHVPAGQSGPVAPEGADEQRAAKRFDPKVMDYLTPTLAKFTLQGKVAVVTG